MADRKAGARRQAGRKTALRDLEAGVLEVYRRAAEDLVRARTEEEALVARRRLEVSAERLRELRQERSEARRRRPAQG